MALAIDHRSQLEDAGTGADAGKASATSSVLAVKAAARVAAGRPGYGMLLDDKYGRDALFDLRDKQALSGSAKPIELPGSRPLRFEFSRISAAGWSTGRSTTASRCCASTIPTIRRS